MIYGGHFDVDKKLEQIKKLEAVTSDLDFWTTNERSKAEEIISNLNSLKQVTNSLILWKEKINDNLTLIDMIEEEQDLALKDEIEKEVLTAIEKINEMSMLLLLNEPYDDVNCILEVHAGAGGTEACDWAFMLFRMYTRWCEKNNYRVQILEYQDGEEAGIKSASIQVKGKNAYGYLKGEKGVHRLVRLSPFDSNNRRHTSFASVEVTPEIDKVKEIEINESDLKIDVYRASGAGGQHVNTTDSAVRITHLPTKIVVTCQNERSQIQNREMAMKILKSKLQLLELEKQNEELMNVKGEQKNIEFGSQIRSYVMHPYSLVKDHRTNVETSNVNKVLDGDINMFIESYLKGGK